ncbi:MAG: hypothetical protein MUE66_04820 [Acidimicrobiia bacterium]|jgi:hypothetical protein|nr:hypothetical protein [Acidimicrobiia bacterium]
MSTFRRIVLVLALCASALGAAGCGGGGGEPIVFGEGEIPSSVPDDLPIPPGAVVGSTMVDRVNHRTEFAMTLPQEATAVVQYYTVNLVSAGFVVDSSAGDPLGNWRIEFRRGELRGSIVIQPGGPGLAAVVVGLNAS